MPRTYIPRSDGAYRPSPRTKKPAVSSPKKKTPVPKNTPSGKKNPPIIGGILKALLVLALLAIIFGLTRWESLNIQSVQIVGLDRLNQERIEVLVQESLDSRVTRWWNSRNIFLAPHQQIENLLRESEPSISDVQVRRQFPDGLVVFIEERYPVFEICWPEQCLFLANDGVAIAHSDQMSFLPVQRTQEAVVGESVYSQRTMDWLEYLVRTYTIEVGLAIEAIEVVLEGESGILEIAVLTQDGYRVRFDFETDLVVQKNALKVVFEAEIPAERRADLEYIDLRVPNRVYYRFRDAAQEPSSSDSEEVQSNPSSIEE